ncbi:MAG: CoA transferase [Rhodospirillales bacterium]
MTPADTPLAGIKVVELSHVLAGPLCGLMLANLGAEVIKIERPPRGDPQRRDVAATDRLGSDSASFFTLNRGKRSLLLDLKAEADAAQLWRLLAEADVLVENYRLGVLDRFGFGYEAVKARHPDLVYCSISGFGSSGPWAERGGFDLVAQALSGIMTFTGPAGSRVPTKCGPPITDIMAGVLGALGVVAALLRQGRGGGGDHVETSLLEAGVMFTYLQSALALASDVDASPMGSAHPLYAPYECYEASDGWIALGTANDTSWKRCLAVLDLPELAVDPRFATTQARVGNRADLFARLQEALNQGRRDDWIERLTTAGVPCGPVLTVKEMLVHPQVVARGMVEEAQHAELGTAPCIGFPISFAEAEQPPLAPAPLLDAKG